MTLEILPGVTVTALSDAEIELLILVRNVITVILEFTQTEPLMATAIPDPTLVVPIVRPAVVVTMWLILLVANNATPAWHF